MKSKFWLGCMCATLLVLGTGVAQAGVIRSTAKEMGKGTAAVAKSTPQAAEAAGGGLATAGKATGSALRSGADSAGKGIAATPSLAVKGTTSAAKGTATAAKAVWKAVW